MATQRHILHADFDAFYVSVERVLNPRLCGRPLVIGNLSSPRGIIAAVSTEARQRGIYPAMTTSAALLRCPSLSIVEGDFAMYQRASLAVTDYLQRFSPACESVGVDETFLDLTGMHLLFGNAVDLGSRIHREIKKRFSLELTIGVAINKLVAKIASRSVRPTGLCDVNPGSESAFLAPLPARRLPGVGMDISRRLTDFNINTVGELAATPRPFLTSAFGRRGALLYAVARGIDFTPVQPRRKLPTIQLEETLTKDTNDQSLLRRVLFSLVEQAGRRLREQVSLVSRLSITVEYLDRRTSTAGERLSRPTDFDDEIFSAALPALAKSLTSRQAVRRIHLRLSPLIIAKPQLSLFTDQRDDNRRRALSTAIDRLRGKHGNQAIIFGRSLPGPPISPDAPGRSAA